MVLTLRKNIVTDSFRACLANRTYEVSIWPESGF